MGSRWVHPYDDERVIAGQGTVALECSRDQPDLESLVVPIGGGGLIAGVAIAGDGVEAGHRDRRRADDAVSVDGGGGSRSAGRRLDRARSPTESRSSNPAALTLPIVRQHVRDMLLVDEGDIEQAIVLLLEVEKTVAEGAGAAGLAALLRHAQRFRGRRAGVVLSGGNIDPLDARRHHRTRDGAHGTADPSHRGAERSAWRPGASHGVSGRSAGQHPGDRPSARVHEPAGAGGAVDLVLETRGPEHVRQVIEALARLGFRAKLRLD